MLCEVRVAIKTTLTCITLKSL